MSARFWSLTALVVAAMATRLIPHPANFTAVTAVALFAGAHFERRWAVVVPLAAMLASDALFELRFGWGFHALMPVVYASFAAVVWLGRLLRRRRRLLPVAAAAVAGPTLFFVTTNFAVWALGAGYPHTAAGLIACYVAAIPFFGASVAGCVFYAGLLFGGFALAERRLPALAEPVPA